MNKSPKYVIKVALLIVAVIILGVSCTQNLTKIRTASAPPQIKRVSAVDADSTTTEGTRGGTYLIIGNNLKSTRSVTFNGDPANVNLALATKQHLIVTVPAKTPFRNASDELVVTNSAGSDSTHFHIVQPPPTITDFNPKVGSAGDTITIQGHVFDGVDSVLFGDQKTGIPAQIISSTYTQIKVKVPQGVSSSHITVVTPGGSTTSTQTFGFSYLLYGDAVNSDFNGGGYNSTQDYSNTEHVASGSYAVKVVVTGNYGGMQLSGGSVDVSNYTTLQFSVYEKSGGGALNVYVNGNYSSNTKRISPTTGQYVTFKIPLSTFGSISTITSLVIQGQGGHPTFYVDNLGFY